MGALVDRIRGLDARTVWSHGLSVPVDGDVGHPQGLLAWDGGWLVSTVHLERPRGELLVVGADGRVVERLEVSDGPRIHPGGMATSADHVVVAVAEYRPDSTTVLCSVGTDLDPTEIGRVDDHLGALCVLDDGSYFAVSWGARRFYRLDAEGRVLDRRENAVRFVEHQDVTASEDGFVLATGVGVVPAPGGKVQLGGVAVIDVVELATVSSSPIHAWLPSGRVATYNGVHLEMDDAHLDLSCIADDRCAEIVTWRTDSI